MRILARSVRDFVQPLEPAGSLDASRSFFAEEDAALQGTRIHGKIQRRLAEANPGIEIEKAVTWTFRREDFECLVRGRIDARFPGPPPRVEEIKATSRPQALLRALGQDPLHPFAQQVRMYAWMTSREEGTAPACRLRVVSLVDETETLLEVPYDPAAFNAWVEAQVLGLDRQQQRAEARTLERAQLGADLVFPFDGFRPGQADLIARIEGALKEGTPLLVQAPTGLGKTAAALFPALRKALKEDFRVFYLTPRNSQHGVAEAFIRRLRAAGYYDRLKGCGALERLAEIGCADSERIQALAAEHALCPFELSLDAARQADVLVGDYNYALSPNATLTRFFQDPEAAKRNLLLVDEAHNLPARAAEWFSPALDLAQLQGLRTGWKGKRKLKAPFLRLLDQGLELVGSYAGPSRPVEVEPAPFQNLEQAIRGLLSRLAEEDSELPPSHPLLRLSRLWTAFCEGLRTRTDVHLLTWIPPGRLQITCMDASAHLAERFEPLPGVVGFSGTLKPFEYYARLGGLKEYLTAELPSPFPARNRHVLMVPQISSRYLHRPRQAPRIAEFLSRVLPLRRGNYLVFFPSFEFLEQVRAHLDLPGFRLIAQTPRASPEAIRGILSALAEARGLVVLAVQGGSLSEGIDLPGEALIGSVVVGPPLPPFDLEHQLTKAHFDRQGGLGEAYTYIYPAMARAIQAAGRVIRGPEERGLLVFLDNRFLTPAYAGCFPGDWFRESPREAISTQILADVARFWDGS